MAVGFGAHLGTVLSEGGGATYDFTVTAPTSGRTVLVFIGERRATTSNSISSVGGGGNDLGLTWTQLVIEAADLGATTMIAAIYAGTGTPNGGTTFRVTFANTNSACGISMAEFTSVDAGTPANIDVQSDTSIVGGVTTLSGLSLGTAPSSATFGGIIKQSTSAVTPNGTWTELGEHNVGGTWLVQGAYDLAGSQSYAPSWSGASTVGGAMIEIAAAAAAAAKPRQLMMLGVGR